MKLYQRLDVQLGLFVVVILSLTVSLTGWLHNRAQVIDVQTDFSGLNIKSQMVMPALEPLIRSEDKNIFENRLPPILQLLDQQVPGFDYLVIDEHFDVVADTTTEKTLIEMVRPDVQDSFYVVISSAELESADALLIYTMIPGLPLETSFAEQYILMKIPEARLLDPPEFQPILLDGLRNHINIFGWYYLAVIVLIVQFIRIRLSPLRKLEQVAEQLSQNQIPEPIKGAVLEDEVGQLVAAFNAALNKLAENEAVRKRMIADIAHELRTPLTNISGRIEAYEDNIVNDSGELIKFTSSQIEILSNMVEDMSLLTSIDADELVLNLEPIKLKTFLNEALTIASFGQRFAWSVVGDDAILEFDPWRFQQIISNLVNNSLKAKGNDLVIAIKIDVGERFTDIVFEDNGPGVAAEHLPHLFERLYRADASRTSATGGTGLGLSIVKSLVGAHQGAIECYLSERGGLAIKISILNR